jgi:hypothetical protein
MAKSQAISFHSDHGVPIRGALFEPVGKAVFRSAGLRRCEPVRDRGCNLQQRSAAHSLMRSPIGIPGIANRARGALGSDARGVDLSGGLQAR